MRVLPRRESTLCISSENFQIFIVGDLNLSSVSWPITEDSQVPDSIDKLFLDSFNELGLHQCITEPTHLKNKTLTIKI